MLKIRAMCTLGDEGGLTDLRGDLKVIEEERKPGFWLLDTSEMWCPEHSLPTTVKASREDIGEMERCTQQWRFVIVSD